MAAIIAGGGADEEGEEAAVIAEVSEDFAFALGEPGNGTIGMTSKLEAGWRTSYRPQEPEKKQFDSWRAKWSRARKRFEDELVWMQPPRTRRSQEEQLSLQQKWQLKRRLKIPDSGSGAAAGSAG